MDPSKRLTQESAGQPARRGLAPRERTQYRYADHGRPLGSIPPDDKCYKPTAQIAVNRPSFKQGQLVFRAFPSLNPEDPTQFEPYRESVVEYAFTDWIRSYPAVRYMGDDESFTYILYDKVALREGYDRRHNPYIAMFNAVQAAYKSGSDKRYRAEWNRFFTEGMSPLPAPGDLTFLQGLIFEDAKNIYVGPDKAPRGYKKNDYPQILELPSSAAKGLVAKLNEVKDNYQGDPDDWEKMMVHGDPVSIEHGRFLTFYNAEEAERRAAGQSQPNAEAEEADWGAGASGRSTESGSRGFRPKGYAVDVSPVYIPPGGKRYKATLKGKDDVVLSKYRFWDDIIHVPTHEEICLWIANGFRSVPKLIEFGWQDHPEFMTPEIRAILRSRVTGPSAAVPTDDDDIAEAAEGADEWETEDDTPALPPIPGKATTPALEHADEFATDDEDDAEELDEHEAEVAEEPEEAPIGEEIGEYEAQAEAPAIDEYEATEADEADLTQAFDAASKRSAAREAGDKPVPPKKPVPPANKKRPAR